jgi:hypothetical protein
MTCYSFLHEVQQILAWFICLSARLISETIQLITTKLSTRVKNSTIFHFIAIRTSHLGNYSTDYDKT